MAGLLGMLVAGGAKGYAQGRGSELAQEKDFDLKSALLEAQTDKARILKQMDYDREDAQTKETLERRKSYASDVTGEDGATRKPTTQEMAGRAMEGGDYEVANAILSMTPKQQKIEIEQLAYDAANGDDKAKKTLNTLLDFEKQKAAAGRAPEKPKEPTASAIAKQDFINAYGDNPEYVKDGKLTAKGYDRFNKIDNNQYEEVTTKPSTDFSGKVAKDKDGNPIVIETVKAKRKVVEKPTTQTKPKGSLTTDSNGNFLFTR